MDDVVVVSLYGYEATRDLKLLSGNVFMRVPFPTAFIRGTQRQFSEKYLFGRQFEI